MAEVPEPKQETIDSIVKILSDYKMKVINDGTLKTQAPSELRNTSAILREKSRAIKDYILRRTMPSQDDVDLYACIKELEPYLNPWNSDISVISKYWCEKLFETDNLSNAQHMQDLLTRDPENLVMPAKA
jgi:hypothetical protein